MKNDEKAKRIKFIRALQKVASNATTLLKKENFDAELFAKAMQKNELFLQKCEAVSLNATHTKALLEFVNACFQTPIKQNELLSLANALDKGRKSKKIKHKNKEDCE